MIIRMIVFRFRENIKIPETEHECSRTELTTISPSGRTICI